MEESIKKKPNQLRIGSAMTYIQTALSILISLSYTPIMLRILGRSEYGLYSTVASTIAMLSILSLGLGSGYMRYYIEYKKKGEEDRVARLNGLFLSVFIVIGLIALGCGLFLTNNLELVFKDGLSPDQYPLARTLMLILTANLTLNFPFSIFSVVISANERFIFLKSVELVQTAASPLITLPLLLMGRGSVAIVAVTVSLSVVTYFIYAAYGLTRLKMRFKFGHYDWAMIKNIVVFSGFIAISIIVDQIDQSMGKMLLTRYCGTVVTAVFSVGYQISYYFKLFSTALSNVFTARIHMIVQNTKDNIRELRSAITELFVRVGRIQFLIVALVATGLVFFGKTFIYFWAGDEYANAYYVMLLLVLPNAIPLCQNLGIEMQRAQNKHYYRSAILGGATIVNLVLTVILCQKYGEIGAGIGAAVGSIVGNGIAMNIVYHKNSNIDIIAFWKSLFGMFRGLVIPIAFGVALDIFFDIDGKLSLVLGIAAYTAVYCVSMWFLAMNDYEKGLVLGVGKKLLRIKR